MWVSRIDGLWHVETNVVVGSGEAGEDDLYGEGALALHMFALALFG